MSRLIDRGMKFLQRIGGNNGVSSLVYTQVGGGTVTLTNIAWEGRTAFRSNQQNRPSLEWSDRDYLIPAAALVIGAVQVLPQRGDRLAETLNGATQTFEIVTPDNGERAWRFADPQNTLLRVHVKRVS